MNSPSLRTNNQAAAVRPPHSNLLPADTVQRLTAVYLTNPYPTHEEYGEIAEYENVEPKRIKAWFARQRRPDLDRGFLCYRCRYFRSPLNEQEHSLGGSSRPCLQYFLDLSFDHNHQPSFQPDVPEEPSNFILPAPVVPVYVFNAQELYETTNPTRWPEWITPAPYCAYPIQHPHQIVFNNQHEMLMPTTEVSSGGYSSYVDEQYDPHQNLYYANQMAYNANLINIHQGLVPYYSSQCQGVMDNLEQPLQAAIVDLEHTNR